MCQIMLSLYNSVVYLKLNGYFVFFLDEKTL